jgi:hypothetical protein
VREGVASIIEEHHPPIMAENNTEAAPPAVAAAANPAAAQDQDINPWSVEGAQTAEGEVVAINYEAICK